MSRKWLASNLTRMRKSGDPSLPKLAYQIIRFRKTSGSTIDSLGEIVHINSKGSSAKRVGNFGLFSTIL